VSSASVRIHPSALDEAEAATEWYRRRSARVARMFLDELDLAVEGLTPRDPLTFLAAAVLVAATAALGSYLPAQRASRLDPMTALRDE